MEYLPQNNLLLEALAYFGRRAAGHTTDELLTRLRSRGVTDLEGLQQQLKPFDALMRQLDREISIPEAQLQALFGNLSGFSRNTVGSFCPVFLLYYSTIFHFTSDVAQATQTIQSLSKPELAGRLAVSLEIADEDVPQNVMSVDEFTTRVFALSVPAESKVAILELYHQPQPILDAASGYLTKAVALLQQLLPDMQQLCASFSAELQARGAEDFLAHTSSLRSKPEMSYQIHPFLFGMDTNLAVTTPEENTVQLYCGIFRRPLQDVLNTAGKAEDDVHHAIKLLADRTRFDILCYLRDREAYGQELSTHFGLSRNTIHHHMSKLLAARLVKCTVDGNRVYYTVDQDSIAELLQRQRALLLP